MILKDLESPAYICPVGERQALPRDQNPILRMTRQRGKLGESIGIRAGGGYHSKITFPELPERMMSKPF
jgi:hypothetical protein